jgi:uncharacterized protein (DUF736 family)
MGSHTFVRAVTVAILVATSTVAMSVSLAGVAAAQPAVTSIDAPDGVTPGQQTTINVTGAAAGEIILTGDTGGWTVESTADSTGTLFGGRDPVKPNETQTPYATPAGANWSYVNFESNPGTNYLELTVTAPQQTGTYNFTAVVKGDSEKAKQEFSITVSEEEQLPPEITVSSNDEVAPGQGTIVNVTATNAGSITVTGDTGGWVVNSTADSTGELFGGKDPVTPSASQTPYATPAGANWSYLNFDQNPGTNYLELSLTAPEQEGTHTFTTMVENSNEVKTKQTFSIEVNSTVNKTRPSGTDQGAYEAAAGPDGELGRNDVVKAINAFFSPDRDLKGFDLDRNDVVGLINEFFGLVNAD